MRSWDDNHMKETQSSEHLSLTFTPSRLKAVLNQQTSEISKHDIFV